MFSPSNFGYEKDKVQLGFDKGFFGGGRLTLQGTRSVVAVSGSALCEHMQNIADTLPASLWPAGGAKVVRSKTAMKFLRMATLSQLQKLAGLGVKFWHGTVTANQYMYVPSQFLVLSFLRAPLMCMASACLRWGGMSFQP